MRILLSALLFGTLLTIPTSTSGDPLCPKWKQDIGGCPAQNTGTEVVVEASHEDRGTAETIPVDNWVDWVRHVTPWVSPNEIMDQCLSDWDDGRSCFLPREDDAEDEEDSVEIPPVTIHDVARFAPDGPSLAGEPDNVGVAGLPTNFVAEASPHTVDGELFGFPVTVRFTPAAFDFTYGDGTSETTASGGRSWDDLDQAQFTPTPTSHIYDDRGTYMASVNVRYTAEVDFGVGWFSISGEVTTTGPSQEIRIYEAHTALVAHTCDEAPNAPGC